MLGTELIMPMLTTTWTFMSVFQKNRMKTIKYLQEKKNNMNMKEVIAITAVFVFIVFAGFITEGITMSRLSSIEKFISDMKSYDDMPSMDSHSETSLDGLQSKSLIEQRNDYSQQRDDLLNKILEIDKKMGLK